MRTRALSAQAVGLIRQYIKGGSKHSSLETLRRLRNHVLAHHQMAQTPAGSISEEKLNRLPISYMRIRHADHAASARSKQDRVQPKRSAEVFSYYARCFWNQLHQSEAQPSISMHEKQPVAIGLEPHVPASFQGLSLRRDLPGQFPVLHQLVDNAIHQRLERRIDDVVRDADVHQRAPVSSEDSMSTRVMASVPPLRIRTL